ncbi:hypothetical protein OG568_51695 (plasmid) [Streptomyces sp. NBC_01450]|uniref:hypothetical protein n=1 Tax=Streptomyces sp. NBC_01450 TaxID=2903871 RepID=UPI002E35D81D|nr:hypothetical protein [Streptomyces sp. NBC_01450]
MLKDAPFFPVPSFTADDSMNLPKRTERVGSGVDADGGGSFLACDTGEFQTHGDVRLQDGTGDPCVALAAAPTDAATQ